jgi:hopanoid biosynthesis associated RND transporter like protein HpnN
MTIALSDMSWATWISFAGVWLLIFLFFRSGGRTFIRIIALVVGMCWTFGWTTLFIGHLNILSVVFAPLLIGLGDDYIAHWFARLEEEERQPGVSPQAAILRVGTQAGPGILTAGASAALSFLPFVLTGFKGLIELGLITGVGILLNVMADLIILPILSLYSRPPALAPQRRNASETADLLHFSRRQAFWLLLGLGVLSVYGGWHGWRVGFDLNPLHLQARGTESVEWEERLRQHANRSVIYASTVGYSADEVFKKTAAFQTLPTVWKVQSVFSLLPEQQEEKLPHLHAILADFPAVRPMPGDSQPPDLRGFMDVLGRIRFKMDDTQAEQWGARRPVVEQIANVRALTGGILAALQQDPPHSGKALGAYQRLFHQDLRDLLDLLAQGGKASLMRIEDIPRQVRDRFLQQNQYLIRVYPREDIWEREPRDRFVQEIRNVDGQVVGDVITLHDFTDAFQQASIEAAGYALLAIALLLILTFRDWRLCLVALLPLLVGTLLTFEVMGLAGIQFNPANTVFLPIIVGVGVEYGIVILHRWQEGRMLPGHLPLSTGKGVILAALTTTIGFGSLIICRHRGIFSLGFLSFVGSLFVLAAAILLVPAVLSYMAPPQPAAEKEE